MIRYVALELVEALDLADAHGHPGLLGEGLELIVQVGGVEDDRLGRASLLDGLRNSVRVSI